MAPRLWFLWTWPFALASLAGMLSAAFLLWTNRGEFGSAIVDSPGWHSLVAVYATIVLVTIVHEFAHGLTCKHYGGKVQEMGFLVMMLMPCLYCNVSDAWMIPDKRKRMLITLAGAWSDLTVWAVGVHLWRLTMPDTLPHHIAALAVSVTGFRTFINLLPLLKLDGYYLLSDWLDAPNLKQRGTEAFQRGVRHAVWGEQPATPAPAGHRGFALYGMLSWIAMVVMIAGLGLAIYHFLGSRWGALGIAGAVMLGLAARQIVAGLGPSQTAVGIVSRERGLRFGFWLAVVAGVLCIPVPDLIHGAFELRPKVRMQIRAPVAGFVRSLQFEEGARLSAGTVVGTLEVPDLDSRLGQKRAELQEAHARLALLKAGPREEDLEWQRRKVQTSKTRVATAEQRLERTRLEAQEESARLEQKVSQHLAESQAAKDAHRRASALFRSGIVTGESVTELQKREQAMDARLGQVKAEQRGHAVIAARDAEEELALRREELREAEAELELVEAGSRPEEIDAEQARIARLNEELAYLETLQSRQKITSPVSGVVTSRHLKEKVGEYLKEGDLICEVEDTSEFDAEVMVLEDELARLREEQPLRLKVRAMPFDAFDARIERIAPRASKQTAHSEAIVICRVKDPQQRLRPGMTGSACIDAGDKMLGRLLLDRSLRFVRTEFWWW